MKSWSGFRIQDWSVSVCVSAAPESLLKAKRKKNEVGGGAAGNKSSLALINRAGLVRAPGFYKDRS